MKDNSVRRMSRAELLELLIQYTDEKEALQAQLDQVKAELAEARRMLNARAEAPDHSDRMDASAAQLSSKLEDVHAIAMQCLEGIRSMQDAAYSAHEGTEMECITNTEETHTRRRRRGTGL